jgi:hypothetical protein
MRHKMYKGREPSVNPPPNGGTCNISNLLTALYTAGCNFTRFVVSRYLTRTKVSIIGSALGHIGIQILYLVQQRGLIDGVLRSPCLKTSALFFFFLRRKALQDKAMQRQTSKNQRDAPGQDTGRSQGHLSSYLLGGPPGERHRARCKTDSRGCDTHRGGLDERPTQNLNF